jgi:hypothetical protein
MVKKIKSKRSRKNSASKFFTSKKADTSFSIVKTQRDAWILGILFLAFCAVTITFPGFSWALPDSASHLFFYGSWQISLFLLGILFIYIRFFPQTHKTIMNDISSFWARVGLWIAFALTLFLCFYHMGQPIGGYSFDLAVFVELVRRMKDLDYFADLFITKSWGIFPAWPYTAIFFWHLFPLATGLEIQRITSTFYELGTIWVMYLCGKEIGGRRVGLLAAILISISEPLVTKTLSGYPISCMTFASLLVIWSQTRLLRKNSIWDFLLWALSIGFFSVSGVPALVLIPFFIFSCLGLLWWSDRDKNSLISAPYLVWISLIVYLFYFCCCLNFIPNGDRFVAQIKRFGLLIPSIIFALIGFVYFRMISEKKENFWLKWFCGAGLAVLLSFRSFTDDYIVDRIKWHTIVPGASYLDASNLTQAFFERFPITIKGLFWVFQDIRDDMMVPRHSIFSYPETILIALGLVFYFSKPDFKRTFLLITAILAIIPQAVMKESHSAELINCVVPLLLVGAMGLNDLLVRVFEVVRSKFSQGIICFLLVIFWAWAAQGLFFSIYPQWAEKRVWTTLPQENVLQDIAQGRRVYLTKEIFDYSTEFYEGSSVYLLHESNPIYLTQNENIPDVVIYFIDEGDYVKKLKERFPDLNFEGLYSELRPGGASMCRCVVSSRILSDKRQNLFSVVRTPDPEWKRTYNYHLAAVRGSIDFSRIDWQDRIIDPIAPLPEAAWEKNNDFTGQAIRLETTIQVNADGQHEITCKTGSRTKLIIDGNLIFDLKFMQLGDFYTTPAVNKKVVLNLTKGEHQVEVITLNQSPMPEITIKSIASSEAAQSLWKGFSFD